MKTGINISIRQRIYLGFFILVCLFTLAGIITNLTLQRNKKLSERLTSIIDPSLENMDSFEKMLIESKMYTTNWVFLRYSNEDKQELTQLHDTDYGLLKVKILVNTSQWTNHDNADSMHVILNRFEELLGIEKKIMQSLHTFNDYDDPVTKLEAERLVEEEVLPRTAGLLHSLHSIYNRGVAIKAEQNSKLEDSSARLRVFIIVLAIAMIGIAVLLSIYFTRIIISPIKKINTIVNDLGKGILRRVNHRSANDEIGSMIISVNKLSENLQHTAAFAHEIGHHNFNASFQPLSDEDTLGKSLIAMRDNLHTNKTSLEIKNRELERKNKELEQFAYVASHDLQEPLRTTTSFVELLQSKYKDKLDEKGEKYISYVVQAAKRMQVLITDLLEYSRIGSKKELKQVDCNQVVREVLADLGSAIQETGAQINVTALPVIHGYQTEIKQLFQNLAFNAIKFRKKDTPPQLSIGAVTKRDSWEFSFADNGIGIDEKHNERIFVIFQRLHTRSEYKGSGIGLSHCKKIVELHNGRIWVKSTPGEGSTFYFTIHKNNNQ